MRRTGWIMAIALAGAGLGEQPSAAQVPTGSEQVVARAESFLRALDEGKADVAAAMSGPQMKAAGVTAEMLAAAWQQLSGGARLTNLRASAVNQVQGFQVVDFAAQYGEQVQWYRVSVDAQQNIEGFRVVPQNATAAWEPPRYAHPDQFDEVQLTVGAEGWPLGATLALPKGEAKPPVVVLVHGSGPHDRDETLGAVQPFKDLAWGLASNGVGVLRYEKRTWKHGSRMLGQPVTVEEEVIADALAVMQQVRQQPRVDPERVFLLGHSLGGMLAPEIAVRDGGLAGIILLAGTPRSLEAVTIEQLDYIAGLPESKTTAAQERLGELKTMMEKLERHEIPADQDAGGAPASYFYDLEQRVPAKFVPQLKVPVLVLQGGRDYQVTKTDFDAWQGLLKGVSGASFKWYPDLNHLFVTGQDMATPTEYSTQRGHVDARVIADIAAFVKPY